MNDLKSPATVLAGNYMNELEILMVEWEKEDLTQTSIRKMLRAISRCVYFLLREWLKEHMK